MCLVHNLQLQVSEKSGYLTSNALLVNGKMFCWTFTIKYRPIIILKHNALNFPQPLWEMI